VIEITPLASSSAGNAYKITDGQTVLLLEAGIRFRDIQRAMDFRLSHVGGCLITHEHGDHGKAAAELIKAGVDIYASEGTLRALKLYGHHRAKVIKAKGQFQIGTWTILPFDIEHDVEEPLGFLMQNTAGDKLVFITDSYYCRYTFKDVTHYMIEVNYCMDVLNENIRTGVVPVVMKSRLMRSHFSLENAIEFLRANDLSKVEEIWTLHLSDSNSDEALIKRRLQEVTGKPIFIAKAR
jgi:phosphoribosyl 1,2-cyclic phosphodiesterase